MGLAPTRNDNNEWNKPREDGYDFMAAHVDNLIVVSKDSASYAKNQRNL